MQFVPQPVKVSAFGVGQPVVALDGHQVAQARVPVIGDDHVLGQHEVATQVRLQYVSQGDPTQFDYQTISDVIFNGAYVPAHGLWPEGHRFHDPAIEDDLPRAAGAAGGVVEVTVVTRAQDAQLVVRDTGDGISPEFLPAVFDRFRQADTSVSRKFGGSGLGLPTAKRLIEAHAGEIAIECPPAGGTKVVIRLPLAAA